MDQEIPECEKQIPFLRSCKKEEVEPIEGKIRGNIPEWLQGTLVRVGSGLLNVGPDKYNHLFDGLALLHRFSIQNGRVTYQSKFLRSDTYNKNMAANRILVTEFGTRASPDPCKTIFQRISSYFWPEDMTDNDLVNIVHYSDECYACSETNFIWRIDPSNLDSLKKVNLSDYVSVRTACAHAHTGNDGTVYNIGFTRGSHAGYSLFKFPPKEKDSTDAFASGSIISRIPASRMLYPSYFHSFGMSENYFIFVEQPLVMSFIKLIATQFTWGEYADSLQWQPEYQARFFIIRRKDGLILSHQYLSDAIMLFHHINAYEEDNHLVIDICCIEDGDIVKKFYIEALRNSAADSPVVVSRAKRFVLPVINDSKANEGENLVTLAGTKAKALLQTNSTVLLQPEIIGEDNQFFCELPRINYEAYNGKKYQFFYAVATKQSDKETYLIKVNTQTGATLSWVEPSAFPSEPVFVARKDSQEEDDGVLVASLVFTNDERKISLLVLDARTLKEMGRVDFATESSVPGTFHGIFIQD